jgi:hypothetical protein
MEEEQSISNPTEETSPDRGAKTSVSERKLAANRENAKKSTGPRSESGKARSSQNAFKHGVFALPLYPTDVQLALDHCEYDELIEGLRQHYQPIGYLEGMLLEKIAAAYIRSARLLRHEQRIFELRYPFEARSAASLPRYQTAVERQLAKDIERLESLQARRKAEATSGEGGDVELQKDVDPAADTSIESTSAPTLDIHATETPGPQSDSEAWPPAQSGAQAGDDQPPALGGEENAETNPPRAAQKVTENSMLS